jgi:carbon storage regulator
MLILTLTEGKKILIGDDISVKVLEVRGKQIRIGIEAPASLIILRENMVDKDKR